MEWTDKSPTEPGLYMLQKVNEWTIHVERVHRGKWQDAQNPDWLYCSVMPVHEIDARWLGPLPEPPNKYP